MFCVKRAASISFGDLTKIKVSITPVSLAIVVAITIAFIFSSPWNNQVANNALP